MLRITHQALLQCIDRAVFFSVSSLVFLSPGELMDGRRGLVPSNFVERVSDEDLLASLPPELADLSHSSGPELSFLSGGGGGSSSGGQSSGGRSQPRPEDEAAGEVPSPSPPPEGLGEPPAVPYPRRLAVLKQLAHSVVLAWEPPPERVELCGYHVCVNGELRQALGSGAPPTAVLENLDLQAGPLRVSVQALTSRGGSDPLRCCLLLGARARVAPSQLRVHRLTATSAEIAWVPSNSSLAHAVYLNGEECLPARPSTYWATFCHLRPGTLYQARVEAQLPPRGSWEPGGERPEPRAATLQFTTLPAGRRAQAPGVCKPWGGQAREGSTRGTLAATCIFREVAERAVLSGGSAPILGLVPPPLGPPDAPLDVQVEPGPSPGILIISWLPVTIDAAGTSNGVRVTGYAVYADGQKVQPGGAHLYPGSRAWVSAFSHTLGVGYGSLPSPVPWERGMGLFPFHTERPCLPGLAWSCPPQASGHWVADWLRAWALVAHGLGL